VALGADPATILGAVTPVPDTLFRVSVCGAAARLAHRACGLSGSDLQVPASSEIVLEGAIRREGRRSRVRSEITPAITTRGNLSRAYGGRITIAPRADLPLDLHRKPPDEPAVARRGVLTKCRAILHEAVPRSRTSTCRREGCSYRLAVVT